MNAHAMRLRGLGVATGLLLLLVSGCALPFIGAPPSAATTPELSVIDCEIHPAGTAADEASADGICTVQHIIARACHVSPEQVAETLSYGAVGDSDTLTKYGSASVVYASVQTPINGGELIVSCLDGSNPTRAVDPELYMRLLQPGDVADLPEWLQ